MEKEDLNRSGIRKSLLSGLGNQNPNATKGRLTDEENAKGLARRLFEFYNKDQSGVIADYELGAMMSDVYKSIGRQFNPTSEDIQGYTKVWMETKMDRSVSKTSRLFLSSTSFKGPN